MTGLLPYRELDDVLGLTVVAGNPLADARTGIFLDCRGDDLGARRLTFGVFVKLERSS